MSIGGSATAALVVAEAGVLLGAASTATTSANAAAFFGVVVYQWQALSALVALYDSDHKEDAGDESEKGGRRYDDYEVGWHGASRGRWLVFCWLLSLLLWGSATAVGSRNWRRCSFCCFGSFPCAGRCPNACLDTVERKEIRYDTGLEISVLKNEMG